MKSSSTGVYNTFTLVFLGLTVFVFICTLGMFTGLIRVPGGFAPKTPVLPTKALVPTDSPTPTPSYTPLPTATKVPTKTPQPTSTPTPTSTLRAALPEKDQFVHNVRMGHES